jgi:uncharacterized repeat protein (TIGR01451 family)
MKQYSYSFLVVITLFLTNSANAQNSIISTVLSASGSINVAVDNAGNIYTLWGGGTIIQKTDVHGINSTVAGIFGTTTSTGDGGPATAATLCAYGMRVDGAGNIYLASFSANTVRKITAATGIISTVAGNGTPGYSGDGGPATAARLSDPTGVSVDGAGNLYIAEKGNEVIRKVDPSGIITTIAGMPGVAGYSGDGGTATAAALNSPFDVIADNFGNIYISDQQNNVIRKINPAGVISTHAGNGTAGYSGDGGLATAAELNWPQGITLDMLGNVLVSDGYYNHVVRKINGSGIISTFAGTGTSGYTGDGGPATAAQIYDPIGLAVDRSNCLFFADDGNYNIRKVGGSPFISSTSFSVFKEDLCGTLQLTIFSISTAALSVKTYYGDGNTDYSPLVASGLGTESVNLIHVYDYPGTYTVKHVLYNTGVPVDSVRYSYEYKLCNTFPVKFFYDLNGNCVKDGTEPYSFLPVTTEVDSNGIAIDTIAATSGFYYHASGNTGDIYSFRILSHPGGLNITCPYGGILYDTLQLVDNSAVKYGGFTNSGSTDYDLQMSVSQVCGRHMEKGNVIVENTYCTAENPTVTMNFDSKYLFTNSNPAPSSVSGNTVTWDMTGVTALLQPSFIQYTLNVPSTWITTGDTAASSFSVSPLLGDADITNNNCQRTDTITGSFDPNEISVAPGGVVVSGTKLTYTINFENTGNDTAFNIYVMDTLSDNVDPMSMNIVAASATMNTSKYTMGGHTTIKFDFPDINLPDSSHHNQCDGMFTFTVNVKNGLPDGTTIFNHAGIFFDYNPVVMTNTVENVTGTPPNTTGIVQLNQEAISLYPNPATNDLTIKMNKDSYSSFTMTNGIGQVIMQQPLTATQTHVDIKTLPAGLYYIQFRGDYGSKVQKFVKM